MAIESRYESDQMSRRFRQGLKCLSSLLLLVACLASSIAETKPEVTGGKTKPVGLTAGGSIKRELTAGAKELFEISLSPGQLLRLSIDKGDLALSLTLHDPAGQKLLDRVSYEYETLDLSLPAEVEGTYLIEVGSLELDKVSRSYEVKVEPLRLATPMDYKRETAQRALASATILRTDWTEKSLRQAIENYDEAGGVLVFSRGVGRGAGASNE